MKKITMFYMSTCPHCARAANYMNELYAENEAYKQIEVERIDEVIHADIAEKYDYYFVPTFYVGDEKTHEGSCEKKDIKKVFDAALAE